MGQVLEPVANSYSFAVAASPQGSAPGLSQALAKRSLIRNLLGDARLTVPALFQSFLYPFFAERDPRRGLPAHPPPQASPAPA